MKRVQPSSAQAFAIAPRSTDWKMLCVLAFCAAMLAGVLKAPALARYAEQRFHLSLNADFAATSQALESISVATRAQAAQFISRLDRAAVFGMQELLHGEVTAQQLKQAQTLRDYQALQAKVAASQLAQDASTQPQSKAKFKAQKNAATLQKGGDAPSIKAPVIIQPTPFRADYAMQKLRLSAGDRVLFMGDSLMQGVAPHAAQALNKALPGIFTLDLSRQSTGLAYPGFFDWPATAMRAITQHRINTVVVFIGANDFYDMPIQGKKFITGSPPWEQGYSAVVLSLIAQAHGAGARIVWMEMPAMDKPLLRERVPALNGVYAKSARLLKARWVATSDVMGAANGAYSKFLPNAQGTMVQMRSDDGVHFTVAGQKRLALKLLDQFDWSEQVKP